MVNHFYVYCMDRDFGPFFLKFRTYFPYNAKLCLNGHEYVKRFQLRGFTNREMRALMAQLLGLDPANYPIGRMTYDLRRLRLHGLIERIPKSHRYDVTPTGLRIALFFTRTYARLLRPKLAQIMPEALPIASPLRAAFDRLTTAIDTCCNEERLAA